MHPSSKFSRVAVSLAVSLAATLLSSTLPADPTGSNTSLQQDALSALSLFDGDVVSLQFDGAPGQQSTAHLSMDGEPLTLALRPSSVLADGFQLIEVDGDGSTTRMPTPQSRTFRGTALEFPGSIVAASLLSDGLYGRVRLADGNDLWIQPLLGLVEGATPLDHVVYLNSDIMPIAAACGGALFATSGQASSTQSGPGTANGGAGLAVAELGIDSDFEYYQDYGSNSTNVMNQITSVIDTMNLQYEGEVGITHVITTILVRTSSNQPYTSTNANTLLDQFLDEWNNNQGSVQRDTAHLFTGKSIQGGTIGIAYVGVICNQSFGYGLVESDFNNNFGCSTDLSAHELGHNWNAGHCSCANNTMNAFITCTNTFNASLTRPTIESFRDSRVCLDVSGGGPAADFTANVTSGAAPLAVSFTDLSSGNGLSSWSWTFGDGGSSTQQDPTHIYLADGTYDVSLTVVDSDGSDSATKLDYIVVNSGGTMGLFTKYGENSGGSNIGTLCSDSDPIAGQSVVFDVSGIPNGTEGILWISTTQISTPMFGGTLLASLGTAPFRLPLSILGGSASISFTIPPGASGLTAYCQAGARDTSQSGGIALTNGLQMDIF
ncbi:MAG: hypothetical protein ACI8QS_003625 [Planctomycetota bacterium]|jgi:hypothetical protein